MPGRFNVSNALAAVATACALGVELEDAVRALAEPVRVPGRLEPVDEQQQFAVLVDYAHTPDSLTRVLAAARELAGATAGARVLCVFGAGGDRDRGKRPLMGQAAAVGADLMIVTSDNPRSEDPEAIIAEIVAGVEEARRAHAASDTVHRAGELSVIVDRRQAIARAVELARPGDVVVIAGKGHEQGQELVGGRVVPFDDIAVARAALRGLPVRTA
jgi:UDP-N-acetylmuramoyl-L-alanyl-D-glutamate--2,6-diaminopimelate ligase